MLLVFHVYIEKNTTTKFIEKCVLSDCFIYNIKIGLQSRKWVLWYYVSNIWHFVFRYETEWIQAPNTVCYDII